MTASHARGGSGTVGVFHGTGKTLQKGGGEGEIE
jgi:hypothetical protein